jgi:hypothetical protein
MYRESWGKEWKQTKTSVAWWWWWWSITLHTERTPPLPTQYCYASRDVAVYGNVRLEASAAFFRPEYTTQGYAVITQLEFSPQTTGTKRLASSFYDIHKMRALGYQKTIVLPSVSLISQATHLILSNLIITIFHHEFRPWRLVSVSAVKSETRK